MRIVYSNSRLEKCCTSLKEATKLFGGDKNLALSLLSRIEAIEKAEIIKDVIVIPTFHFHTLEGKRKQDFSIDVRTRRDKWRIILCPLDENEQRYDPCHIDELAPVVRIVKVLEVSAHYE